MGPVAQPTLQVIVELSGEAAPEDVQQLTLRGQGITSFEPYAASLPALECLSLSHNQLTHLAGFTCLHNLVTLNLNNNSLSSLDGLQQCCSLQQLYAANNHIRCLQPLATLTQLRTLTCMKNSISSLNECLQVLCNLVRLADLDLSSNPVASVPSYKDVLIDCLPGLQLLDGERLLDSERKPGPLASSGLNKNIDILTLEPEPSTAKPTGLISTSPDVSDQPPGPNATSTQHPPQPALQSRPSTAAAASPGIGPSMHSMPRPGTPSGYTHHLLSDPGLNDHPLVLQYLATHVLSEALAVTGQKAGAALSSTKSRGSFAARLRTAASVMSSSEGLHVDQLLGSQTIKAALPDPGSLGDAAKAFLEGASPHEVTRQLLRLAEVLIKELDQAKQMLKRSPSSSSLQHRPSTGSAASGSSNPTTRPSSSSATPGTLLGTHKQVEPSRQHSGGSAGRQAVDNSSSSSLQGAGSPAVQGSCAQGPGSVASLGQAGSGTAGEAPDPARAQLEEEVVRLRREVKQLQAENQNVYWLADEVKRLKAQLAQAQAPT